MEIIPYIFIWSFSIYGILEFIRAIIKSHSGTEKGNYKIIIVERNQEETIEGFLRTIMLDGNLSNREIFIYDLDSKDNTRKIVNKIGKDFNNIKLINREEYEYVLADISGRCIRNIKKNNIEGLDNS